MDKHGWLEHAYNMHTGQGASTPDFIYNLEPNKPIKGKGSPVILSTVGPGLCQYSAPAVTFPAAVWPVLIAPTHASSERWPGWVDVDAWLHTEMDYPTPEDGHPSFFLPLLRAEIQPTSGPQRWNRM